MGSTDGIEPDTTVTWLIRDKATSSYMTKSGTWGEYARAGSWGTPEEAPRALLDVDDQRFDTVELVEETRTRRPALAASKVVPRPTRSVSIPSSWIGSTGTMSARHLQNTRRLVDARAVDPRDLPAVLAVFQEATGRVPGMR